VADGFPGMPVAPVAAVGHHATASPSRAQS
jgi:hypothetical protein